MLPTTEPNQLLQVPDDKGFEGELQLLSCCDGCSYPASMCTCNNKADTNHSDRSPACDSKPSTDTHFALSLRSTSACCSRRSKKEKSPMLVIDKNEVARCDRLEAPRQARKRATSYREYQSAFQDIRSRPQKAQKLIKTLHKEIRTLYEHQI